jgi:uncharacterized protein YqhQ
MPSEDAQPQTSVGGQAVLEGVMMRAPTAWAVAVRKPDGVIEAVRHALPRLSSRSALAKVPLVRGVLVLGESLTLGYRALTWSAQKAAAEEEEELTRGQIAGSMTFALVLFIALFVLLPAFVAGWVSGTSKVGFAATEAVFRLVLFIGYLWAIGRSKEIKRVFQYHGAEHMSIYAYEAGEPLTIENVSRHRPEHPRCGTNFLMIVILLTIVIFTFVGRPALPLFILSRVIGIPVIAGISYEILKFAGLRQSERMGRFLAAPGMWLQKLTTGVPEPDMIEVAVASLVTALEPEEVAVLAARGAVPTVALEAIPSEFDDSATEPADVGEPGEARAEDPDPA